MCGFIEHRTGIAKVTNWYPVDALTFFPGFLELEVWRHEMFHIVHFLQSDMVCEIANPFSCILNAISSENSCLISVPFLTC